MLLCHGSMNGCLATRRHDDACRATDEYAVHGPRLPCQARMAPSRWRLRWVISIALMLKRS